MKNVGCDPNVPPNKLRHGYGEYCCLVILRLINKALERRKPNFRKIKEEKVKEDSQENNIVEIEEDMPDMINKEIDYGDAGDAKKLNEDNATKDEGQQQEEDDDDDEMRIIHPEIARRDWMREVEKVSSKLKIEYNDSTYSGSEWRGHLGKIKTNDAALTKSIPASRNVLENLSEDIGKILGKISKKEENISKNFAHIIKDIKGRKTENNSKIEDFNQLRNKVDKMEKDYEELEEKSADLEVSFLV